MKFEMVAFGKIHKLGDALTDAVRQIGIERRLKEYQVITEWREIVGDAVANNAVIKRFEFGKLVLSVSNSVWRQELSLAREKLRKTINDAVGMEIVQDIILR